MFFRIADLVEKKNHAGFKKCWTTTVSSRDMSPFGSAFPAEAHGEVEVFVVCSWHSPKPDEESLQICANLKELKHYASYGFVSYHDHFRTDPSGRQNPLETFLSRIPQSAQEFAAVPGFEGWTLSQIEETFMEKGGIAPFLMPRRWILNKGQLQLDFHFPLDAGLPNGNFRIGYDKKAGMVFVPLTQAEALPPPAAASITPSVNRSVHWVLENRFACLPLPETDDLPVLVEAGLTSLAVIGTSQPPEALESAGVRPLLLVEVDVDQVREFLHFCRDTEGGVGVCSDDPISAGTLVAMGLVAGGLSVVEAVEQLDATYPAGLGGASQTEFLYQAADELGFDPFET